MGLSIGVQEQRGCSSSLEKGFFTSDTSGEEDGRSGKKVVRKRKENWLKMNSDINYVVGEDIS